MKKWIIRIIFTVSVFSIGFASGFLAFNPFMQWKWERETLLKNETFMNKTVPNVTTTTIRGEKWELHKQYGKVLLIDFWATWCGPCVASMPKLKELYEKYKDNPNFAMVGVSLDNDEKELKKFIDDEKIMWLQLFEKNNKGMENSFAKAFQVTGIPSVWIVDKNNKVIGIDLYSKEDIVRKIDESLNENG
ncbi:MAG: TlpA family protein disulfide reductase [Desulfobacteraceae bacterium]|nr:TlpA family protein disulfide reductase [Desulfobacteraceae bacterium]